GSLMLSPTIMVAFVSPLSIPPRPTEFMEHVKRDWKNGVELVKTCMHMHDS
ncbi:glycoside hydrolase family 47 protein, partial [Collybiopsis luxurians FD-317 M1]